MRPMWGQSSTNPSRASWQTTCEVRVDRDVSGGFLVDIALEDLPDQLGNRDVLTLGALSDLTMQVGGYTHLKPWRMGELCSDPRGGLGVVCHDSGGLSGRGSSCLPTGTCVAIRSVNAGPAERTVRVMAQTLPGFDRLIVDPETMAGQVTIRGLRFTVEHLLELLAAGRSIDEMRADFPLIEPEDVRQALGYAAMLARRDVYLPLKTLVDQNPRAPRKFG